MVSLLAIDKKLTFVEKGHDITKEDVINALTNTKKFVHEGSKKPHVTFDEVNSNFIMRLQLDNWRDCTPDEAELVRKMNEPIVTGLSSDNRYSVRRQEPPTININPKDSPTNLKSNLRDKFPETWFFKSSKMQQETESITETIPDSMTTWLITAFSMNKAHGLAIAEPKELIVSQEFFLEFNLPYSIKYGEVLKLEIIAFNFIQKIYARNLSVELKVFSEQQFEFVDLQKGSTCTAQATRDVVKTDSFEIQHKTGNQRIFNIRSKVTKTMTIKIAAVAYYPGSSSRWFDEVKKSIVVENEGVTHYSTHNFEFKINSSEKLVDFHEFSETDIKPSTVGVSAVIAGDMMGPALNYRKDLL